jgi:hypothetical protein
VKSGETTDIEGRLMDTESEKTERRKETYQILENLSWIIMKQTQLEEKPFMSSLNICPDHPISQLIIRKIIKRRLHHFSPPRCFLHGDKAKRKKRSTLRLMNGNN